MQSPATNTPVTVDNTPYQPTRDHPCPRDKLFLLATKVRVHESPTTQLALTFKPAKFTGTQQARPFGSNQTSRSFTGTQQARPFGSNQTSRSFTDDILQPARDHPFPRDKLFLMTTKVRIHESPTTQLALSFKPAKLTSTQQARPFGSNQTSLSFTNDNKKQHDQVRDASSTTLLTACTSPNHFLDTYCPLCFSTIRPGRPNPTSSKQHHASLKTEPTCLQCAPRKKTAAPKMITATFCMIQRPPTKCHQYDYSCNNITEGCYDFTRVVNKFTKYCWIFPTTFKSTVCGILPTSSQLETKTEPKPPHPSFGVGRPPQPLSYHYLPGTSLLQLTSTTGPTACHKQPHEQHSLQNTHPTLPTTNKATSPTPTPNLP
jgi:hypothetical protein